MLLRVSILSIFVLLGTLSYSQRNMEKGDRLFDLNKYEEAIPYYEKEIKTAKGKDRRAATLKLADSYRLMNEFEAAEKEYKQLISRGGGKDAIFSYGMALKAAAKYAEAKEEFLRYNELDPEDPRGMLYARSCDSAQRWLDAEPNYDVFELMEFNTAGPEIAPTFYKGGLLFSSERKGGNKPFVSFEGGSNDVMLDLYFVELDGTQNSLYNEIFFFPDVNTDKHEGPASFSPDGREMYYTKTVAGQRLDKGDAVVEHTLQVFYSFIVGDTVWSDPISALPFNSLEYSVMHPAISPDGRKIFFASDMPGGYGGTDIYVAYKKEDGEWTKAYNLGPEVNTFGFELYPFYDGKGHLYFSSNGLPGMGRLDIFKSSFDSLYGWSHIDNMKVPVNSIGDDICYVDDGSGERGFIVSNRINGTGNDDIYVFNKLDPLMLEFENGALRIQDNSLYTGLAFKVKNMQSGSSEYLEVDDEGYFYYEPEPGVEHVLSVRKNMFLVNKINFRVESTGSGKQEIHINTRLEDVRVRGFIGEINDLRNLEADTLNDFLDDLRGSFLSSFSPAISFGTKIQEISVEKLLAFDSRKKPFERLPYAGIMTYHLINGSIKEKDRTDVKGIYEYKLASTLDHVIRLDKVPEGYETVKKSEADEELALEEKVIEDFSSDGTDQILGLEENGEFYEGSIQLTDGDLALANQSFVLIEEGGKEREFKLDEYGVAKFDSLEQDKLYTIMSNTDDRLMPVSFTSNEIGEAGVEKFEFDYIKKNEEVLAVHEKNQGKLGWELKNNLIDCKVQAESQKGLIKNEKFQLLKDGVVIDELESDEFGLLELENLDPDHVYTVQNTGSDANLKPRAFIPNQMAEFEVNQVVFDDSDYSSEVLIDKRNKNSLGWEERGGALNGKLQVTVDGRLVTDEKYILYKEDKNLGTVKVDDRGIIDLSGLDENEIYTLAAKDTSLALPPMSFLPKQLKDDNHLVLEGIGLESHKDKIQVDPLVAERLRWITDGETVKSRVLMMSVDEILKSKQVILRKGSVIIDTLDTDEDGTLDLDELSPNDLHTISAVDNGNLSPVTFKPQGMWYVKKKVFNLTPLDDTPAELERIPLTKEEEKNLLLLTPVNEEYVAWRENGSSGQLGVTLQVNNDSELLKEETFELYKNGEFVSEVSSDLSGLLRLDDLDANDKYSLKPSDNDGSMEEFEFTPKESQQKDTKVFNFSLSGDIWANAEKYKADQAAKDSALVLDENRASLNWTDNDGLIDAAIQVNNDEEVLAKSKFDVYLGDEMVQSVKSDKNGLLQLEALNPNEKYSVKPSDSEGLQEEFVFVPKDAKEDDKKVFNFSLSGEVFANAEIGSEQSGDEDLLLLKPENESQTAWYTQEETGFISTKVQVNNRTDVLEDETFMLYKGDKVVKEITSDSQGLLSLDNLDANEKYRITPLNPESEMKDFTFVPKEFQEKDKRVFNFSLSGEVIAGAEKVDQEQKKKEQLLVAPKNESLIKWVEDPATKLIKGTVQVNKGTRTLESEDFMLFKDGELIAEVSSTQDGLLQLDGLDANANYELRPINSNVGDEGFSFIPKKAKESQKKLFDFTLDGEVIVNAEKLSNKESYTDDDLIKESNESSVSWNTNNQNGLIDAVIQVNNDQEIIKEETFLLYQNGNLAGEVETDADGLMQLGGLNSDDKYSIKPLGGDGLVESFDFVPKESQEENKKVFNFSLSGEIYANAQVEKQSEKDKELLLINPKNSNDLGWMLNDQTGELSAKVQVNSGSKPLENESFEIYKDGELIGEVKSNEFGLMSLDQLNANETYTIKPINPRPGVEEFVFVPKEAIKEEVKVFDFKLSGEVLPGASISKNDQKEKELLLLSPKNLDLIGWSEEASSGKLGARIQINNDNDILENETFMIYKGDDLVGELETDENGLMSLASLDPNEKYTLRPLDPKSGMEEFDFMPKEAKDDDVKLFDFKLSGEVIPGAEVSSQKDREKLLLSPINKNLIGWEDDPSSRKITGRVQINNDDELLSEETFMVYKGDELVGELDTDENGLMSLEYLDPNEKYTIKPLDPKPGMEAFSFTPKNAKKENVQLFDFQKDQDLMNELASLEEERKEKQQLLVEPKNEFLLGWEEDLSSGKLNAKIQINNDEELLSNETFMVYKDGELVGELDTDENGLMSLEYLDPDQNYSIKPLNKRSDMEDFNFTPKKAYQEDQKVFDFQSDENLLVSKLSSKGLGWKQEAGKLNGLVLIQHKSRTLANETFLLYQDGELIGEIQSNSKGEIDLNHLDPTKEYSIKPISDLEVVQEYVFIPLNAKNGGIKIFDLKDNGLPIIKSELTIDPKVKDRLGWTLYNAKIDGTIQVIGAGDILPNQIFELWKDGKLIKEISSDEFGVIETADLDPKGLYTIKPKDQNSLLGSYSFVPELMQSNEEEVLSLPTKADSDPAILEDFDIFFDEIKVEELFLNITEGIEEQEKLALVVLKNGKPLALNQVELLLDDALVSLNQTDSSGALGEILDVDKNLKVRVVEGDEEYVVVISKNDLKFEDGIYKLAIDIEKDGTKDSIYGLDAKEGSLSGMMKILTDIGEPLVEKDIRIVDENGEMILAKTDADGRLSVELDPNKIYQIQYLQDGQMLKQIINPLDLEKNQETQIVLPSLSENEILGLNMDADIAQGKLKLLSASGDLLANAPVRLVDQNGNVIIGETDGRGFLDLELNPDLNYTLEYIKDGVVLKKRIEPYQLIASADKEIRLPSIDEDDALGLVDQGGTAIGLMKILEANGDLVANAPVRLIDENGEVIISETNGKGYLDLGLDPTLSYTLEYIKDGVVLKKEINPGQLMSNGSKKVILPAIDEDTVLGLELDNDLVVGKLTLKEFDGNVLPNAPVRLIDENGEVIITETNKRGYLDVELKPGMGYSLEYIKNGEVLKKEFKPNLLVDSKQKSLVLPPSTAPVSLAGENLAVGKLKVQEFDGSIVANAPVRLVDENGEILIGETDENGLLDVELKPDMNYSLEYIKGIEVLKQEVQTDILIEQKELTITLPELNEDNILGLSMKEGLAMGRLKMTSFNGDVLANAPVRLIDANGEIIIMETDENGYLDLSLDPSMDYQLEYIEDGTVLTKPLKPSLLIDSKELSIALPELKEDDILGLETRGSLMMGKLAINDMNGLSMANKTIRLVDENGNVQVLETDENGRVDLAIAPKGMYSIEYLHDGEVVSTKISSDLFLNPKTKGLSLNAPALPDDLDEIKEGVNLGSKSRSIPVSMGGMSLANQLVLIEKDGVIVGKYRTDDLGNLDIDLPDGSYKMYVQDEKGIHEINIDSKQLDGGISFPELSSQPADLYSQPVLMALKELGLNSQLDRMLESVPGYIKTIFVFENKEELSGKASLYKDGELTGSVEIIENRLAFNSAESSNYTVEVKLDGYEEYLYSFIPKQVVKDDVIVVKDKLNVETLSIETKIMGRVFNNDKALFDVDVKFFEEGEDYGATTTDHEGRFTYELRPGEIYTVSVLKNGFESKQITFIPEDLLSQENPEIIFYLDYKQEFEANGTVKYDGLSVPNASVKVYKNDKIIHRTQTDSLGNYALKLREDDKYVVSVTKEGFFQENKNIETFGLEDERNKNIDLSFEIKEIKEDENINLTSIYFDYGSVKINQTSKESLNRLVDFLKSNPNVERIEIGSHTDQVGSAEFNLALSQQRAKSVENYLVRKGVPRQKVISIGYGENKPVIKKATTEQEQRLNRRTEFKVVKYKKAEAEIEVVD